MCLVMVKKAWAANQFFPRCHAVGIVGFEFHLCPPLPSWETTDRFFNISVLKRDTVSASQEDVMR